MKTAPNPLRILATAYDYRPCLGGIATLGHEALKALSSFSDVQVRLLAPQMNGDNECDQTSPFEIRRLPMGPGVPRAVWSFYQGLNEEIRIWKPHAILNFLWIPEGISSYFSAGEQRKHGIPYFVYAHGLEVLESKLSWKRRLRNGLRPLKYAVFKNASAIFVNSRYTQNLIAQKCQTPLDQIHVVNPAVDPATFQPGGRAPDLVEKYGLHGKKVFLTVTRLDPYKGIDQTILALKSVVQKHPEVIYLVCGEGRDQARLEAMIQENGLRSHVRMSGRIPFNRISDYYNLCDAYVMLSREHIDPPDVEGFGIVFLEAAACEKPSIAGHSGGVPDAVENGKTGWLVPPTQSDQIARTLLEVLENPDEVTRRGRLARERVLSYFTWQRMAQQFRELIRASLCDRVIK